MAAARITAACALVTASASSPKHTEISKRQKKALLAVIKKETLPVEKIPDIVSELSQAKWCPEDLQEVIDALQDTINDGEESDDLNNKEVKKKDGQVSRGSSEERVRKIEFKINRKRRGGIQRAF